MKIEEGRNKTELDMIHLIIIKLELFPEYFVDEYFFV